MRSLDYLIDSCMSRAAVLTLSAIDPMSTLLVNQSSTEKAQVRTAKRYTKLKTCGYPDHLIIHPRNYCRHWKGMSQVPATFLVDVPI